MPPMSHQLIGGWIGSASVGVGVGATGAGAGTMAEGGMWAGFSSTVKLPASPFTSTV